VGSLGNDGRVAHTIASGDYRRPINRARARARISIFITTENKTRQRWDVRSVDGLFLLVYRVRCRICSRVAAANVDSGRQTERERERGGERENRALDVALDIVNNVREIRAPRLFSPDRISSRVHLPSSRLLSVQIHFARFGIARESSGSAVDDNERRRTRARYGKLFIAAFRSPIARRAIRSR
jgi:hypothetical protein